MTKQNSKLRFFEAKWANLLLAVLAVSGCNPSQGQEVAKSDESANTPSRWPTVEEMLEVTASQYRSPPKVMSECLGRLTFDIAQPVQWPTYHKGEADLFSRSFSDKVWDRGDEIMVGNAKVSVIGPMDGKLRERVFSVTPTGIVAHLQKEIASSKAYIKRLEEGDDSSRTAEKIADQGRWISQHEETIRKKQEEFKLVDLQLPQSYAYYSITAKSAKPDDKESVMRAYLTRGSYLYVFESEMRLLKPSDIEIHKKNLANLLKNFRVRAANEIPSELGVCIPHGFIADDGKTDIEFKQSIRFQDAPGVIYTISTGNVIKRRLKFTPVLAATRAATGLFGSYNEEAIAGFVKQRIGPRPYKMGGLTGEQGGLALNITQPGEKPFEMYSIFTGYSGWLGTHVLPYIIVDMRTFSQAQAPELEQNPPPFKQSMDRLDVLLKGMRLRPTTSPMPELAKSAPAGR